MNEVNNTGYYAILSYKILVDNRLKPNEKLLFAHITTLANKDGYCFASNRYFSKIFTEGSTDKNGELLTGEALDKKIENGKITISKWLKSLVDYGYVKRVIVKDNDTNEVIERRLYPLIDAFGNFKSNTINSKSNRPDRNISNRPINSKSKYNNTSINNTSINVEQPLKTDYIDFNELLKQGKNIGVLGQAKALLQEQLNYLTFDDFDNKIIQRMLNSIHSNIKANNAKKGIFTKTTQQDIINAFKKAITALQDKGLDITSLSYLNSCLNQNLYLQPEEDYTQYIEVIKTQFKHYNKLNAFDISKLKAIINTIKKQGSKDTLEDFKTLFNNLPDYILKNKSYQSVSYIASKIDDLLQVNDIEYLIENHESYAMLKESYGEKRAKELIRPIFSKSKSK